MLNASKREFTSAFKKHIHVFKSVQPPHINHTYKLILFYAIECGLKSIVLDRINGNGIEDLLSHQPLGLGRGTDGHNIKRLLQFLNYPCRLPHMICMSNINRNKNVPPHEYNQVWRYGIRVDPAIEEQVVTELKDIANWIEERLA